MKTDPVIPSGVDDYSRMTWGHWYWPAALTVVTLVLLVPEVWALSTNAQNSLSYWVWRELGVTAHPTVWTALHLLVFGLWIVAVVWLTGHFYWRLWT